MKIHCISFYFLIIQMQISENSILMFTKQYFPHLSDDRKCSLVLKDPNFYSLLKKMVDCYQIMDNFVVNFENFNKNEPTTIIGAQSKQKIENANVNANLDLQSRKNTRAAIAMRNSKNQQQLKKDQIFVRVIPRTHNCIQFMIKNSNFPRIQCRLSCNQHLEYLVNHLTNKWLRGKVGVGYQIKLYPDPSTYMQNHHLSSESRRANFIYEPLNNYLMFTDIMAAFGVSQNGCINLLYDITELRKQKEKFKIMTQKEQPIKYISSKNNALRHFYSYQINGHQAQKPLFQSPIKKQQYNSRQSLQQQKKDKGRYRPVDQYLQTPSQNDQSQYPIPYQKQEQDYKNQNLSQQAHQRNHYENSREQSILRGEHSHQNDQQHANQIKMQENIKCLLQNHQDISIGLHRDHTGLQRDNDRQKRNYLSINNHANSIDYSEVNSLGYQFNAFNSNHVLANIFNMNSSNTFLNIYDNNRSNYPSATPNNPIQATPPAKQPSCSQSKTPQQSPKKQAAESNINSSKLQTKPVTRVQVKPVNINYSNANNANSQGLQTGSSGLAGTAVDNNKLQNLRNIISIVEREVANTDEINEKHDSYNFNVITLNKEKDSDTDKQKAKQKQPEKQKQKERQKQKDQPKQQNMLSRTQSNLRKQVKTVTIIKKKNITD